MKDIAKLFAIASGSGRNTCNIRKEQKILYRFCFERSAILSC